MNEIEFKENLERSILQTLKIMAENNIGIDSFGFTNQEKRFILKLIEKYHGKKF